MPREAPPPRRDSVSARPATSYSKISRSASLAVRSGLNFCTNHWVHCRWLGPRIGTILLWFSYLYALAMVARYVVTMLMKPELRWFTGTVPIWFHFVLAAFIYTLGRYSVRDRSAGGQEP
jgi:hypothetical protein